MTLIEALQDICKGRIIDNGCNYELIALAKGTYKFWINCYRDVFEITLKGKQGENAATIQREFNKYLHEKHFYYSEIYKAEYTPNKKKGDKKA